MKSIHVGEKGGYNVLVGRDLLKQIGKMIRETVCGHSAQRVLVVADEKTDQLFGGDVVMSLKLAGFEVFRFVTGVGETFKRLETAFAICSKAAVSQLNRGDIFIALGGGVICDLAGFAASIYMRGTAYIQIPTTVLSQNDSSVGGKTGVDLEQGKNMIGSYHQPILALCDINTLSSLPDREWRSGVAEIIKHACIASDKLFEDLGKQNLKDNIENITIRSISIKSKIVTKDSGDRGIRKYLNLGHTIGHAIEKLSGYSSTHGDAVAVGMVAVSTAGEKAGFTEIGTTERLEELLKHHGLPISSDLPPVDIIKAAMLDEQNESGYIELALLKKIGDCVTHRFRACELKDFFAPDAPQWLR